MCLPFDQGPNRLELQAQILGFLVLSALSPDWAAAFSVAWVVAAQGICGATTAAADAPSPRIDAFVATTDGFALAEQDLLLRGPGELVGERQSGSPPLYLADLLRDTGIVAEARRDALELHARDPDLADPRHERLREVIRARWGGHLGLGRIG